MLSNVTLSCSRRLELQHLLSLSPSLLFGGDADTATRARALVLRLDSAFEKITDRDLRAVALFEEAGEVIQTPRCLNCHPATERPTRTDQLRPHEPPVVRSMEAWVLRVEIIAITAIMTPISTRHACQVVRDGVSLLRRWLGKGVRLVRSVTRSRILLATVAKTCRR